MATISSQSRNMPTGDPQKWTMAASAMMARPRPAAMSEVRTGRLNKGIAKPAFELAATVRPRGIKPLRTATRLRVKRA